jgi:membrane-associated protease RseP (regulator of RpoE activity)
MSAALLWAAASPGWAQEPAEDTESPAKAATTVVTQVDETGAPQTATVVVEQDDAAPETIHVHVEPVKPGEYWLGLRCSELDNPLLMKHLNIEQGVVVMEVVPASPAAAAGLQADDILIQVGEEPLKTLRTLIETTEKTKEAPLSLMFIRQGQKQTATVTPAKRPPKPEQATAVDDEASQELNLLQESLRLNDLMPQIIERGEENGTKMLFMMPGFVLPDQLKDFPQDLEVTITKKGSDPAKATVKRGEEQWEVDAKSIDKLPAEIRPYVQQMLGGHLSMSFSSDKALNLSGPDGKPLNLPKIAPEIIKRSFKVAPKLEFQTEVFKGKLPAQIKAKIDGRLKEAQEKAENAEKAAGDATTQALEKVQQELKELREQLEKFRSEKADKAKAAENTAGEDK